MCLSLCHRLNDCEVSVTKDGQVWQSKKETRKSILHEVHWRVEFSWEQQQMHMIAPPSSIWTDVGASRADSAENTGRLPDERRSTEYWDRRLDIWLEIISLKWCPSSATLNTSLLLYIYLTVRAAFQIKT